jgi:hypothetical protein
MKASNIEKLQIHKQSLVNFAEGLYELYDYERDGEDFWTAYQFDDGSYADVNIYKWESEPFYDVRTISVVAYPVDEEGNLITDKSVLLLSKQTKLERKKNESNT